jgi:hypothetical protein
MIASLKSERLKTPNEGSKPEFHLRWIRELVPINASVDLRPRTRVQDPHRFAALSPSVVVYTARLLGLGLRLDLKGGKAMFGQMNVTEVLDLRNAPAEVAKSSEGAVARLLEVTDHPKIEKWVQFPKAVFVFLVVAGDTESGAFYVYDRRAQVWYWVDFEDEKFGGYSVSDFDRLVRDCRFLDLVERPALLTSQTPWIVQPGARPQPDGVVTGGGWVSVRIANS